MRVEVSVPGSNDLVLANVDANDMVNGPNVAGGATGENGLQISGQGAVASATYALVVCNNTPAAVNPESSDYALAVFRR